MSDGLRHWQRPLNAEQIAMLEVQFAKAKKRIESFWGKPMAEPPWVGNHRDE